MHGTPGIVFVPRDELEARSPSRPHGIDARLEAAFRWSYCEFLKDAGIELRMPQLTIATATVFCHRFYARHSHAPPENNRYVVATACLFLAGKVEETPKSLREVVRVSYLVQHKKDYGSAVRRIHQQDCFERQREHVLNAERLLLHALRFDFNVDHPYKHILSLAKRAFEELEFTQNFSRNLTQVAWNFANDSLRTTLCLQFTARAIAAAVLHLASKLSRTTENVPKNSWDAFGVAKYHCDEISNQIMDLYEEADL
jgi:cyclin T